VNQLNNKCVQFLYECSLFFIALAALPKILYQLIFHKKYRASLLARLGLQYPIIEKKTNLIWVHAVSVGETKAVVSLARELKRQFPDLQLVVSSTTETGHAEAKRSLPFADQHVYLPLDFSFIVRRIIERASPDAVILCESDFWYNFLRYAKAKGAALLLVNGKMSEKSMRRFCRVPFFSKRLLGLFDVLCLQNQFYRERFEKASAPMDRVFVTGNLKLDEDYPQLSAAEINQWKQRLGIESNQTVLTVGSTHASEEQFLLSVLKDVWKDFSNLKVLLVPRHPERFKEVANLLEKESVATINFTEIQQRTGDEQVLLIDTMGMLRMCYQLSDIALVGGSYTHKVGGHNILEPCWYGKPVLFGPHMHSQMELVSIMNQYGAGFQVSKQDLKSRLEEWLKDESKRQSIGQKGLRLIQEVKGSTKRTLVRIDPFLERLKKENLSKAKI
jgi:3-deoxy-D-manno-octulosonic-acid transferase